MTADQPPKPYVSAEYAAGYRAAIRDAAALAPADPHLPSDPDPNAVEVAPGTWRHWGLYLRGAPADPTADLRARVIAAFDGWTMESGVTLRDAILAALAAESPERPA